MDRQKQLIIGYHARKTGFKTYTDMYQHAAQLIADELPNAIPCPTVFVSGPRSTHVNINEKVAAQLASRSVRGNVSQNAESRALLFHASYLDLPWSAKSIEDNVFDRIDRIINICAIARADIVIHTGSHIFESAQTEPTMRRLAQSIERAYQFANARNETFANPRIFLETMSNDSRFGSVKALNSIFDPVRTTKALAESPFLANIGLCIDTAHIWAAGADITTRENCAALFDGLRKDIPVAVHLNDSKEVIGTKRDEHTGLGRGEIWSLADGYITIVEWAREHDAPIILERNDDPETEVRADLAAIRRNLNSSY